MLSCMIQYSVSKELLARRIRWSLTFLRRSHNIHRLRRKYHERSREFVSKKPELKDAYVSGRMVRSKNRIETAYMHRIVFLKRIRFICFPHEDNNRPHTTEYSIP